MEQSVSFYTIGAVGIGDGAQPRMREDLESLGVSVNFLNDSELEFMLSRNVVDQKMIGIIVPPEQAKSVSDFKANGKYEFFVAELDSNEEVAVHKLAAPIIRSLSERSAVLSRNLATTALELSEVRAMFDNVQRSHVEIEKYLDRHALLRPHTLFSVPAGKHKVSLPAGQVNLHQPLPHDPYGLCAVSLNLASAVARDSGFEVDLLLGPDLVHRWALKGPLPRGRLLLSLPSALSEQYRIPSLVIRAMAGSRDVVELAFAEQRVTSKWSARLDERDLEFPLALGLDFAPPGTTVASRPHSIAALETPDEEENGPVMLGSWSDIKYRAEEIRHDWQLAVTDEGTLQAHPLLNAAMVVHLADLDLSGMRRLRAEISLAHDAATRIGFAIALIPRGRSTRISTKDVDLAWASKRSGWFELSGKTRGTAVIEWEPEEGAGMSVALVTACLDKKADFAWARWGTIVLER